MKKKSIESQEKEYLSFGQIGFLEYMRRKSYRNYYNDVDSAAWWGTAFLDGAILKMMKAVEEEFISAEIEYDRFMIMAMAIGRGLGAVDALEDLCNEEE